MKKVFALLLALCMVFALCACGSGSAPAATAAPAAPAVDAAPAPEAAPADTPADAPAVKADLTVGTGGVSGTYYGYTGMVGKVVSDNTGIKMTIVDTGGSKDNLVSMEAGMYDLATVQSDVMTYAYNGTNSFAESGALPNFRVLCALYPETVQLVTVNPDIKSVADLAGKTVCVGDVGSGTYFNTIDVLAAYGLSLDDINVVYQSFGASTDSMKNGSIDAAFVCAGAPTPSIDDLCQSKKGSVSLISIDDEHMTKLLGDCPWYASITIPGGTYAGVDDDFTTITVKATLVCTADTPDDVAYTLVKTIFEHKDDITALHEKGSWLSFDFATDGIAVPFAKGAAQYFAENGITVATVD